MNLLGIIEVYVMNLNCYHTNYDSLRIFQTFYKEPALPPMGLRAVGACMTMANMSTGELPHTHLKQDFADCMQYMCQTETGLSKDWGNSSLSTFKSLDHC